MPAAAATAAAAAAAAAGLQLSWLLLSLCSPTQVGMISEES